MSIFEEARGFIENKKFNKISENMYDIGRNNVFLQIKNGRSILTCSCTGSSMFADNNLCSHKIAFISLIFNEKLYSEIDKQLKQANKYKELGFNINNLILIDMLEKIKVAE